MGRLEKDHHAVNRLPGELPGRLETLREEQNNENERQPWQSGTLKMYN